MASDAGPVPTGPAPVPQKHVSGMLLSSIIVSIGGFFVLPILGPLVGLTLAWFGRKRVRANPMLVGPRLAMWAIGIAILSLPLQAGMIYRSWPGMQYTQSVGTRAGAFFEHLRNRDYEKAHGEMGEEWRAAHTVEDLKAEILAAFPGEEPISIPKEQIEFREDFAIEEFQARIQSWLDEDYPGELTVVLPVVVRAAEDRRVGLDLTVHTRREGYGDFTSRLIDFRAEVLPPKDGAAAAPGGGAGNATPAGGGAAGAEPGDGGAEEPGPGGDGAGDAGSEIPPDEGPKAPEDESPENPR